MRRLGFLVVAALVVAIVAAIAVAWDFTIPSLGRAKYQAIFLTNGQTYFGRYADRFGPYARLENAYYIQQTKSDDPDKPPDSKLVRRGAELHQPLARMLVPKDAILFVEDLQPSSPIAQFMDQDAGAK